MSSLPHITRNLIAFSPKIANHIKHSFTDSSSEFLSAISHELKTPLNAIIGFSDALREEILQPASVAECMEYIAEISRAANEMNELVHDLLDVGQVASGEFSVDVSREILVADFVNRAVRLNYDYALKRHVTLAVEIADDVKMIKLDAKRMKQILTNLVSNAVKYSPENSVVKIICRNVAPHPLRFENKPNPEFLEIIIADQGFGMDEMQIKTAFEKYKNVPNPSSGKVDSFGLGLPIAKNLVELQKGIIEVYSEIGKGTEMKLRFPYLM